MFCGKSTRYSFISRPSSEASAKYASIEQSLKVISVTSDLKSNDDFDVMRSTRKIAGVAIKEADVASSMQEALHFLDIKNSTVVYDSENTT
jgi:hypothetical protein